jgi:hypothetical protein
MSKYVRTSKPGVYPSWLGDEDIMAQIVEDLIENDGKHPYDFVVKDSQGPEFKKRMHDIVERMIADELIWESFRGNEHILEVATKGRQLSIDGTNKYLKAEARGKRIKQLRRKMRPFLYFIVGLLIMILYYLIRKKILY